MTKRWLCGFALLIGSCIAFTSMPILSKIQAQQGSFDKKSKGKDKKSGKAKGGAEKDLRTAYDEINEISFVIRLAGRKSLLDNGPLFDRTKELYRVAVRAWNMSDRISSKELATAVHDASRGFKHLLRASMPPDADIPEPPADLWLPNQNLEQPWMATQEQLQRLYERLVWLKSSITNKSAREFIEASIRLYEKSRMAFQDKKYHRSEEWSRGAEAWALAAEHLQNTYGEQFRETLPLPKEKKDLFPPRLKQPDSFLHGRELLPPPPIE